MSTAPALERVSVLVPGLPPGPNAQRKQRHWSERYKSDQDWKGDTRFLASAVRRPGMPWPTVRVRYQFVLPDHRVRDWDNLIASVKPCLDGIVAARLIEADDYRHVREFGPHTVSVLRGAESVTIVVER